MYLLLLSRRSPLDIDGRLSLWGQGHFPGIAATTTTVHVMQVPWQRGVVKPLAVSRHDVVMVEAATAAPSTDDPAAAPGTPVGRGQAARVFQADGSARIRQES